MWRHTVIAIVTEMTVAFLIFSMQVVPKSTFSNYYCGIGHILVTVLLTKSFTIRGLICMQLLVMINQNKTTNYTAKYCLVSYSHWCDSTQLTKVQIIVDISSWKHCELLLDCTIEALHTLVVYRLWVVRYTTQLLSWSILGLRASQLASHMTLCTVVSGAMSN